MTRVNSGAEMLVAKKIMIIALLLHNGAEIEEAQEFVDALAIDLDNGDYLAKTIFDDLMSKIESEQVEGPAGDIVKLMREKLIFDEKEKRLNVAVTGFKNVISILETVPKNNLAARAMLTKIYEIARLAKSA